MMCWAALPAAAASVLASLRLASSLATESKALVGLGLPLPTKPGGFCAFIACQLCGSHDCCLGLLPTVGCPLIFFQQVGKGWPQSTKCQNCRLHSKLLLQGHVVR